MDLDCLGSMALARYLYPGYQALRSRRVHPLALQLYRLFQDHLDLADPAELDLRSFSHAVVVDTRSFRQIQEYFPTLADLPARVSIYDHHTDEDSDIPHTECIHARLGANTSLLATLLMEKGFPLSPEDATLALAGVVADTGSFSHPNVTSRDFAAAMWLLDNGADLPLVRKLTHNLFDSELDAILHHLANHVERHSINGHNILLASMSLPRQAAGLSLVVERLADFEQADALFCIFDFAKEKSHLIVARSSRTDLDVAWILSQFGGGGHPQAAAALLKKSDGIPVARHLLHHLQTRLTAGLKASQLMSPADAPLEPAWTIMEAALHLEQHNMTALPVCSADRQLEGILSLKDIQKARKANAMHAPVSAYMSRNVVALGPDTPMREVETAFMHSDFSVIPVSEGRQLRGLITRRALLAQLRGEAARPD